MLIKSNESFHYNVKNLFILLVWEQQTFTRTNPINM